MGGWTLPMVVGNTTVVVVEAPPNRLFNGCHFPGWFQYEYQLLDFG
jgi:hypothetical protein